MQSPEELAREKIENFDTLKDWSSSDKTLSEGKARRVSAGSVNGASRAAVRHRHAIAWAKPEKRRLQVNQFQQFVTPDDGRKFTELYNVQHLNGASGRRATWTAQPRRVAESESGDERIKSSQLDKVSRVCISTIQRLYSMLRSLFFWDRNTDAARSDQREETGRTLCAFNEAVWNEVSNALAY
jgi:hypothetical protein